MVTSSYSVGCTHRGTHTCILVQSHKYEQAYAHRKCDTGREDALPCAVKLACRDSPLNPTFDSHDPAPGFRIPASSSSTTSETSPHPFSRCPFSLLLSCLSVGEDTGGIVIEIRLSGKPFLVFGIKLSKLCEF